MNAQFTFKQLVVFAIVIGFFEPIASYALGMRYTKGKLSDGTFFRAEYCLPNTVCSWFHSIGED